MSDPLTQQLFRRSGTALIISAGGLVAFVWPDVTALSLALVVGLWAVIFGVSQIVLPL